MAIERGLTTTARPTSDSLPQVTPQAIAETQEQIRLLQGMVEDLLEEGVDFGQTPGTSGPSLWDPGAALIISAFGAYAGDRRVLNFVDTPEKISILLEVPLISRKTGAVVGTGIGAASTLETKYKYRWVRDPLEWGFTEETAKKLKTRKTKGFTEYRIPNPEHGDLLNTIAKIASKRAEGDATLGLPGVGSALRKRFDKNYKPKGNEMVGPKWDSFWGECARLGLTEKEVHQKLGVSSMKHWLNQGKSLDTALDLLRAGFAESPGEPVAEAGPEAEMITADQLEILTSFVRNLKIDVKKYITDVFKWEGIRSGMQLTKDQATQLIAKIREDGGIPA